MTLEANMNRRLSARHIEVVDDIVVPILRAKTPAERILMAAAAQRTAREILAARYQSLNPDWSAAQVNAAVARRMIGGTT
jgi:hypothetical protein